MSGYAITLRTNNIGTLYLAQSGKWIFPMRATLDPEAVRTFADENAAADHLARLPKEQYSPERYAVEPIA